MPLVTVRLQPSAAENVAPASGAPAPGVTSAEKHLLFIAKLLHQSKRCVVVTGAGISCNGGIPDFRSVDGLYSLVKKRYPKSVVRGRDLFDAALFRDATSTRIFCSFVGELKQIVDDSRCTPTHDFIGRLHGEGKLLRCYTQNIDCLEQQAGLLVFDAEKEVVEAGVGGEDAAHQQSGSDARAGSLEVARTSGQEANQDLGQCLEDGKESAPTVKIPGVQSVRPPKSRKSRQKLSSNPLVQLHGSLQQLHCTLCSATFPFTDKYRDEFMNGELPPCPQCAKQAEARRLAGKRRIATGTLRPSIVLYNEPHPRGDLVAKILVADIRRKPDLLLVMGTSLKVTGLKSLVKNMAKGIHAAGGCCLFVNKTEAASVKEWSTVFDYQVLADTDEWVGDVDRRIAKLRGPEQRTLVKSASSQLTLSGIETIVTSKSSETGTPKGKENRTSATPRSTKVIKKTTTITAHFKTKKVMSLRPLDTPAPVATKTGYIS